MKNNIKIFVINLQRSTERRKKVKEQLNLLDIEFEFFNAIDSSQSNFLHSEKKADKITLRRFGYTLNRAEVACFASHYALWEKCISLNRNILVFEDNITVGPKFSSYLHRFSSLIEKYHFIKLYSMFKKEKITVECLNDKQDIVYYSARTCGAQGYLLSPFAAKKLIHNAQKFIEPVDNYMEKPWRHGVNTYSFYPDLVIRSNVKSTIGEQRKKKKNKNIFKKSIIETFRSYEYIQYKIRFFLMKIKTKITKV